MVADDLKERKKDATGQMQDPMHQVGVLEKQNRPLRYDKVE